MTNVQSTEQQRRVKLPAAIMAAIKTVATDPNMSSAERFEAVMILVFGYALFEQQKSIDGRLIALPNRQWLEVCSLLTEGVYEDRTSQVNLGLFWMNQGPSSYNE